MPRIAVNGTKIAYDTFGSQTGIPLVLIVGLGGQMLAWPVEFCESLASRGLLVIRFDNRDAGLSMKMEAHGVPDVVEILDAALHGRPVQVPYRVSDMAADTVGLLRALGINRAHLCGISMGGIIAQLSAIEHPERVSSLTLLQSTTGNPALPPPTPEALDALMSESPQEREAHIQHQARTFQILSGRSQYFDVDAHKELTSLSFKRGLNPDGFKRQFAAALAEPSRKRALGELDIPSLIIHAALDPVFSLEHANDLVATIPEASMLVVEEMGHGFCYPRLWDRIADAIADHTTEAA